MALISFNEISDDILPYYYKFDNGKNTKYFRLDRNILITICDLSSFSIIRKENINEVNSSIFEEKYQSSEKEFNEIKLRLITFLNEK